MRKTGAPLVVILAALALEVCRSVPIQNYDQVAITQYGGASLTLDNVEWVIALGATQRDWKADCKVPSYVETAPLR